MLFMLVAPFGKSSAAPERCVFVATHYSTLKHASNKNFVNCFPPALRSRIARHNSQRCFKPRFIRSHIDCAQEPWRLGECGLTPRFPCNSPGAPHTTIGLTWRVVLAFRATIQKKWHIRLAPRSPDFRCGFMPLGTLRPFGRSSRMPLCGCRRHVHHARRNGCARIHFARMSARLVPRATSHSIRIALKHLTKGARHYYVR